MMSRWGIGPSILMYHSIAEDSEDPYAVPANKFQDQVSWLIEHGFEPLPLAAMVSLLKSGDYQGLTRKVVFTFDDGYRDFLTAALPVLLRHKAPATVFIVAGMLGEKASWNENGKHVQLMAEDEIRHIKAQGVALGSHTMTHANLTTLDRKGLYRQLTESRGKLRDLGESFHAFSYPWGQWSSPAAEAVKTAGFECALAVGEQTRCTVANIYFLPRITMTRDMDLKRFQSLLTRTQIETEIRRIYGAALKRI
jgi:peptidoglycan/xylan/chitin deacetylase (PgdA/CDA1 family)